MEQVLRKIKYSKLFRSSHGQGSTAGPGSTDPGWIIHQNAVRNNFFRSRSSFERLGREPVKMMGQVLMRLCVEHYLHVETPWSTPQRHPNGRFGFRRATKKPNWVPRNELPRGPDGKFHIGQSPLSKEAVYTEEELKEGEFEAMIEEALWEMVNEDEAGNICMGMEGDENSLSPDKAPAPIFQRACAPSPPPTTPNDNEVTDSFEMSFDFEMPPTYASSLPNGTNWDVSTGSSAYDFYETHTQGEDANTLYGRSFSADTDDSVADSLSWPRGLSNTETLNSPVVGIEGVTDKDNSSSVDWLSALFEEFDTEAWDLATATASLEELAERVEARETAEGSVVAGVENIYMEEEGQEQMPPTELAAEEVASREIKCTSARKRHHDEDQEERLDEQGEEGEGTYKAHKRPCTRPVAPTEEGGTVEDAGIRAGTEADEGVQSPISIPAIMVTPPTPRASPVLALQSPLCLPRPSPTLLLSAFLQVPEEGSPIGTAPSSPTLKPRKRAYTPYAGTLIVADNDRYCSPNEARPMKRAKRRYDSLMLEGALEFIKELPHEQVAKYTTVTDIGSDDTAYLCTGPKNSHHRRRAMSEGQLSSSTLFGLASIIRKTTEKYRPRSMSESEVGWCSAANKISAAEAMVITSLVNSEG